MSFPMDAKQRARIQRADAALVRTAKDVKLLSMLSWPAHVETTFLRNWQAGRVRLPEVEYAPSATDDVRRELDGIAADLDPSDPLERLLRASARSISDACELLAAIGTPTAGEVSVRMYGSPGGSLAGGKVSNLDAARHFMRVSDEYYRSHLAEEQDYCLPAETLRSEIETRAKAVIDQHEVAVEVDPRLVSKAAAGATRVRLRGGTCFTEYDLEQLLQHEVFVHSLTAINGREQPLLRSLGLGTPRTTRTQEGLATFAELVTGAIDMARMERLALRVEAIHRALSGADFVEVFRYFVDAGQPPLESFNSTMRVFRGVPVTGGSAFAKDVVYLHGMMEVHTFFRWALAHGRLDLARHLFAGRLTLGDTLRLEPYFQRGVLAGPRYLPPWMTRTNGLAAYLAFSVFANRIFIDELGEGHSFDSIEDLS